MLDPFDDIRLRELLFFDRLLALGTITAAAEELGVPKPTASRWLALLEERIGRPLVLRGPRRVTPTDRGRAFHEGLQPLLASARALRASARSDEPGGTLRVSVPVPLGRLMGGSVIAEFRRRMPRVRLEVRLQNDRVDLLRDRVDLAIRGGPLPDSDHLARRLAVVPLWLYASRGFEGQAPSDVPLIAAPGDEAMLRRLDPARAPAAALVDDRSAVCEALCAGAGAGVLPAFLGEPPRARGLLVRLLDGPLSTSPVHAVYLPEQRRDARLRELIEVVEEALRGVSEPG